MLPPMPCWVPAMPSCGWTVAVKQVLMDGNTSLSSAWLASLWAASVMGSCATGLACYLCFSLVSVAVLEGCDLAFQPGLWVIILGYRGGEVIWGRWLGTLWSQAKPSNKPLSLTLTLGLRRVDNWEKKYPALSLPLQ